jgi:peptidoglycan/LPS O-acetylase OafA/YrhL
MATAFAPVATPAPTPSTAKNNHAKHNQPIYNWAIGYLRAFVVMLVVAHHAALAYHPFAPPPPTSLITQPRWWGAFPVADPHKWTGAALLVGFNEMFFMSLMFFLSGLFVWHGLHTKGAAKFLRDRLLRLGLPFAVSVGVLAPLAYYPAYLQIAGHTGAAGFLQQWVSLGNWPVGPAWFISVLLAFDCIAALLFLILPKWGPRLGALTAGAERKPILFFAALVVLSALAYMPMAHHFTVLDWTVFGPFTFQTSRILHYLLYFLIGVGVGAWGLDRGLLAPQGKLACRWPLWVAASLVVFAGATAVSIAAMASWGKSPLLASAADVGFVLSCAASCFAFLAVFLRFARSRSKVWDGLAANSYGIYLFHYVAVNWMLHALVSSALPGIAKFLIVFPGAFMLSWALAETIRRIPAVGRVI